MQSSFQQQVANSTAHRPIRDKLSCEVIIDKNLLPELMDMSLDISDKNHHKACWILELVMEAKIVWLQDYLTTFCNTLSGISHQGALRSVSKICLFAVQYEKKLPGFLNRHYKTLITESCFDWLIDPSGKVATKAYAMRTLYLLGRNDDWIYPELQRILEEDAIKHSTAYTTAAIKILKDIAVI